MLSILTLTKRQKSRLEAAEMFFLRSVAGYRLIDHRRNEDIREEIQIIDINSRIKDYQIKWLQLRKNGTKQNSLITTELQTPLLPPSSGR
jgi:hypothetical protein